MFMNDAPTLTTIGTWSSETGWVSSKAFPAASEAGILHDGHVVVDQVGFRRHQEDVHLGGVVLQRTDHLEVDLDVLDVEGDVLLHLPLDRLLELLGGRRGQLHLLDDHGVPGEGDGDLLLVDLQLPQGGLDPLDDGAVVHDRPVDDRVGRKGEDPELPETVLGAHRLDVGHLDGTRPDVQPDDLFAAEQPHRRPRDPAAIPC
jgi:hypothetical protein